MRAALVLAATALVMIPGVAAALDGSRLPTQHMHDAWNEAAGLPQNSVTSIAQTPDGNLWLGTEEGLVRFDGAGFRIFDRTNTTGRARAIVSAVAVDPQGKVVIGERDGLCRFDEPAFTCTRLPDGAAVTALASSASGLLVGSDHGLFAFEAGAVHHVDALGASAVRAIAPDGPRTLAVTEVGLVAVENGAATTLVAARDILSVARTSTGKIWAGTEHGPYVVEGGRLVDPGLADRPTGAVPFVREDSAGNVWLSVFDDGLYRTARAGRAFEKVPLSKEQPADRLDAFLEDDEGNVWIGSRLSGLHRLRDGPFVPWGGPEGIAHGYVSAVLATDDGTVLAGTPGGLYTMRGERTSLVGAKDGLPNEEISSLANGRDRSILVGTRRGAARVRSVEPLHVDVVPGTSGLHVLVLLEEDDVLWLGTPNMLVALRSGSDASIPERRSWPLGSVTALHRDAKGVLWVGTTRGLLRMRGEEVDAPFADRLPGTTVSAFLERGDDLLVGTSAAGLFRIRGASLQHLDRDGGLFDDTVHTLADGLDGKLWMSSNKGVYAVPFAEVDGYFDGRTPRVSATAWGRLDGMRSRECNQGGNGSARDRRGRLWFATMLGAVAIDPARLAPPRPPRPPIIDGARLVNGQTRTHPQAITLPPNARGFDVTFTSPALAAAERVAFEVRLDGANDEWHAVAGRTASFTSLEPGRYVLEVRTKSDLVSPPTRLAVDVPPRFVETTSFRVGLVAAFVVVVVAGGLLRLRAVERARKELARLVDERTSELARRNADLEERTRALDAALEDLKRAETDLVRAERMASVATMVRGIAHELNNPLAFITGNVAPLHRYADFLLRAIDELARGEKKLEDLRLSPKKDLAFVEKDLRALLADLEEGGRRAKLIVGDLQTLTSGGSRAIESVDLARVVEQSVRLFAATKPAGVTIAVTTTGAKTVSARAGELEQAVSNLVDNALRAVGPGGTIRVSTSSEDGNAVIRVEDDGPGMTEEVKTRAAEPFFTTRAPGEGSGLGLAIVARIAEHHGGGVTIESEPGKGTRVTISIRGVPS